MQTLSIFSRETRWQFIRYALVGLASNLVLYLLYLLLTWQGLGAKTAMSGLYLLGVVQTFFFNRKWTFRHDGHLTKAFWRYLASYGLGYILNLLGLMYFVDSLQLPHQSVQGVFIVFLAAMLFTMQKFWVFGGKTDSHIFKIGFFELLKNYFIYILASILVLYFWFLFPSPEYPYLNKDDGSAFLTLAINIAEYWHYSMDTMQNPNSGYHATWPPAFPLYLAGIIKIFGYSWVFIKFGMVVLGLLALVSLWRLIGQDCYGRLAVLLTALSPYFFLYSHHTMAEVPYMLTVFLSLNLIDKSDNVKKSLLSGLVAGVSFLVRGYSIILLPVGILYLIINPGLNNKEKLSNIVAFCIFPLVCIVAWYSYSHAVIESGNIDGFTSVYGNGSDLLSKLTYNPFELAKRLYWHDILYSSFYMIPIYHLQLIKENKVLIALSLMFFSAFSFGWWISFSRHISLYFKRFQRGDDGLSSTDKEKLKRLSSVTFWIPAKFMILLLISPSARYWLPFLPFLYYYFFIGIGYIFEKLKIKFPMQEGIALSLVLISGFGLFVHLNNPEKLRYFDVYAVHSNRIFDWINNNLPDDAVIISEAPTDVFASTLRKSVSISYFTQQDIPPYKNSYLMCPNQASVAMHYKKTLGLCDSLKDTFRVLPVKEEKTVTLFRLLG